MDGHIKELLDKVDFNLLMRLVTNYKIASGTDNNQIEVLNNLKRYKDDVNVSQKI